MVKSISEVCRNNLAPRIIGLDDAPFQSRPRTPGAEVHAVGIVTTNDRFEGMIYCGGIQQDGLNAGPRLAEAICQSKFHDQIHAVFIDGITMGGLNVIDINLLAESLNRPVVAVMRSYPNIEKMLGAISKVPHSEQRAANLCAAGPIHEINGWTFQFRCPSTQSSSDRLKSAVTPEDVARLLSLCTPDNGQKIPECLRIAHLVGSAIKTGQSSSSA